MQKAIILPKTITNIQPKHNRKIVYVTRQNQIGLTGDEANLKKIYKTKMRQKTETKKLIKQTKKTSLHKGNKYGFAIDDLNITPNTKFSKYSSLTPNEKKKSKLQISSSSDICNFKCQTKSLNKSSKKDYYSEYEKKISKSVKVKNLFGTKKKRVLVKTFLCRPESIVYSYIMKPDLKYSYEEKISISEYESKKILKKYWTKNNVLCNQKSFSIMSDYGYPMNNYSQLMLLEEYEERIKNLENILAQKEIEIKNLNDEYYNHLIRSKNNITYYTSINNDWDEICEPYKIEYLYIKGIDREPLCHQHNVIDFEILSDKNIQNENIEKSVKKTIIEKHETIINKTESLQNEQTNYNMITTSEPIKNEKIEKKKIFDIENMKIDNQNNLYFKKSYEFDQNSNTKIIYSKSKFDILETQKSGFTLLSIPIDFRLKNENQDNFIIQGIPIEEINENILLHSRNLTNKYYKSYRKYPRQYSTEDTANYDLINQTSKYYGSSDNRTFNELKKIGVSTDSSRELVNIIYGLPENDIEYVDNNKKIYGHKRYNSELNFKNNYYKNNIINISNSQHDNYYNDSQIDSYLKSESKNKNRYNNYIYDEANYMDGRWSKIKEVNVTSLYSSENSFPSKEYSIQKKNIIAKRIMKKNNTDSKLLKVRKKKSNETFNEVRKNLIEEKIYKVSTEPTKKIERIEKILEKGSDSNLERKVYRKFYHLEHGDNKVVVVGNDKK